MCEFKNSDNSKLNQKPVCLEVKTKIKFKVILHHSFSKVIPKVADQLEILVRLTRSEELGFNWFLLLGKLTFAVEKQPPRRVATL